MIATLQQLKDYLGITGIEQDVILELLIKSSNQMIETYIGRKIAPDDYVEVFNGNAQKEIILTNYPVNTLTKIEKNKGTINEPEFEEIDGGFVLEPKIGRIFFNTLLQRGFQNYKVSYNGGYTGIPADLTLASLKLASKYYNTKTSDGISGETNNGDRLDFDATQIPNDIQIILNNYRDYEF